jgi:hypothetical protein
VLLTLREIDNINFSSGIFLLIGSGKNLSVRPLLGVVDRIVCHPAIKNDCEHVTEQGGLLEQPEQFEHDDDNDDHPNYVKNVSIHACDLAARLRASQVDLPQVVQF